MSTEFIGEKVWARLRRANRESRRPAAVAVAYFAKGAEKRLRLKKGSRLVVNASETAVRSGLTCPADLMRLYKKGVRIFNVPNLHAKVYVFGRQVFVGSANASKHSESLVEAVVRTTDRGPVKAARDFVKQLCLEPIGPETLRRLQKLYRPPKFPLDPQQKPIRYSSGRDRAQLPRLRLAHLHSEDYPTGSEETAKKGREAAELKRKHRRTHFLDEFRWPDDSFSKGDTIAQLVDENDGPKLVSPPGKVINTRKWSNGRQHCTFVYLEVPQGRRIRLDKLVKRLGRGAGKKLKRSGWVNRGFAEKLRRVWQN